MEMKTAVTMDWETTLTAAAEDDNETSGGNMNVSNHDSSRGVPRASGRVGWAARREQIGKDGTMPQSEGAGASQRRDKHRRSGFSDGIGSDRADKAVVKYQCIGEQRAGSSSDGSDDGSGSSSAEVGATDQRFQAVEDEVEVRERLTRSNGC